MTAAELLFTAAAQDVVLRAEGGRLRWSAPAGAVTDDLRQALREQKAELLAILAPPGLPLQPPDYEVPPEWQPAPPFAMEEQAVYDATLREMAEVLTDAELVEFVAGYGGELYVDEGGALRAQDGQKVPEPVREVVRARQEALVALVALVARAPEPRALSVAESVRQQS